MSTVTHGPAVVAEIDKSSYIDWSGIFVGVIVASALSWLLLTFGSAIGLLAVSPYSFNAETAATVTFAAAIWFALTQIYSVGMGAYIAARLRPRHADGRSDEVEFRDGVTGLAVWGLAILLGLTLAGMAISSAARTTAAAAGGIASTAASQVDPAYTVDLLLRPGQQLAAPAEGAQPGQAAPAQPAAEPVQLSDGERDQIRRIVVNAMTQESIPDADRQYLIQLVARAAGIPPQEAERRISETYEQAKRTATETADAVRQATSFAGFWVVFITLAAGLASWWGGTVGGRHRDEGTWF
jgi:hypothetical protein